MKVVCIENDLKLTCVKIWRNESEDRYVWDVILKAALVKL